MNRIIIMVENRIGVIADITRTLGDAGINVESINTESVGEQGAVILSTDNYAHALYLLNQAGFKAVGDDDTLVIRLRDEPGALAAVADNLKRADVNIQSMHILNRQDGYAMIALSTSDRIRAEAAIGSESIV